MCVSPWKCSRVCRDVRRGLWKAMWIERKQDVEKGVQLCERTANDVEILSVLFPPTTVSARERAANAAPTTGGFCSASTFSQ